MDRLFRGNVHGGFPTTKHENSCAWLSVARSSAPLQGGLKVRPARVVGYFLGIIMVAAPPRSMKIAGDRVGRVSRMSTETVDLRANRYFLGYDSGSDFRSQGVMRSSFAMDMARLWEPAAAKSREICR